MADNNENRGLASASQATRQRVAKMGGESSRGGGRKGGRASTSGRGSNLSDEDRSRGGQNSQEGRS